MRPLFCAMDLRICAEVFAEMMAHVAAAMPAEACGFLSGREGVACRHFPIPNVSPNPHCFRMEPQAQIDALYAIAAAAEEPLAIYHSHPHGPAALSPTDLAQLPAGDILHVIIAWPQAAQPQVRVFAWRHMNVTEVTWYMV
ncbi:MAG: Mov34/MPN/PAD-1 family protein [Anaerolineales bacterium]|nr:Mov34/MPN/PAD-1 family protein [Anaerolineales bacterium]MCB8954344.1 Mov34/MPN/PAD-1 family protein [Ardenticatenales bacterium]